MANGRIIGPDNIPANGIASGIWSLTEQLAATKAGTWVVIPEFVGAGAVATGVDPTVAMPAGIQEGDLLIIAGVSGTGYTNPTGWTEMVNQSDTNPRTFATYKFAGASESSVSLVNSNTRTACAIVAFRNLTASDVGGTLNTTLTTTSLTTTQSNDLVVSIFGDSNTLVATWTDPASTNRAVAYGTDGSGTRSFLVVYEIQETAGATTSRTATISETSNQTSYAHSFKT